MREGVAYPLFERLPVGARDEVDDDLGIGLGGEFDPLGHEARAQRRGVLDDAVVHHRDRAVRAHVRVGVGVGRRSVGRPSRVPDAELAANPLREDRFELGELAGRLVDAHRGAGDQCDAGGVVAAVLEPLEARHQDRSGAPVAYVSDDSAHGAGLLLGSHRVVVRLSRDPDVPSRLWPWGGALRRGPAGRGLVTSSCARGLSRTLPIGKEACRCTSEPVNDVAGCSPSGYYAWRGRERFARARRDEELLPGARIAQARGIRDTIRVA